MNAQSVYEYSTSMNIFFLRTLPDILKTAGLLLLGGSFVQAQNLVVSEFENENSVLAIWDWWGGVSKEILWDSDDADGNASSGSLKLSIGFDHALEDNQYAIGMSLGGSQWNQDVMASSDQYGTLAFDIRWNDESTAALDAYNTGPGDQAFFVGLATADWGQTWLRGEELTGGGWQHVEIAIPMGTPDFPGIIFKKWSPGGGDDTGLSGTVSVSIDNITLIERENGEVDPFDGEVELLNGFDDDLSASGFWRWWGATSQEYIWDKDNDTKEPAPPILETGFEDGPGDWTVHLMEGGVETGTTWETGVPTQGPGAAKTGNNAAGTGLTADYEDGTTVVLRSPVIDPTGVSGNLKLDFWYYLEAVEGEGGKVTVLEADGTSIQDLDPFFTGGVDGNTSEWTKATFLLPALQPLRPFRIQFNFLSAENDEPDNGSGWFIDDVMIGSVESGSLKVSVEFDNTLDDNQYAIGWALSGLGDFDGSVTASAADYAAVALDVKWDSESTVSLDDFNNSGADPGFHMGFATTDWGQSWISNAPHLTEEWQRIVIPIDAATPDFAGLVFKKWQPGGGDADALNGTASFWIDNISLIRLEGKAPPPTLSIAKAAPKGLQLVASTLGQQYQRQNINAVAAGDTVWYGNAEPVSYEITFADFPGADAPGFQAHLFIVPDSGGGGSPDWNDPNVVFIDFNSTDGTGNCMVRYKVDEPAGNSMIYGDGTLGTHTSESILGTWKISFANNTEIKVTGPNGTESVFMMPEGDAAKFVPGSEMSTFLGIQPNQLANIGKSATFSRITIRNGNSIVLDDRFNTIDEVQKVNSDDWFVEAAPEALWVINSDDAYWVNWMLPAPNYSLFTSPNLGNPDVWTSVNPVPNQIGSRMSVLMQGVDLPAPAESYFRLQTVEQGEADGE